MRGRAAPEVNAIAEMKAELEVNAETEVNAEVELVLAVEVEAEAEAEAEAEVGAEVLGSEARARRRTSSCKGDWSLTGPQAAPTRAWARAKAKPEPRPGLGLGDGRAVCGVRAWRRTSSCNRAPCPRGQHAARTWAGFASGLGLG